MKRRPHQRFCCRRHAFAWYSRRRRQERRLVVVDAPTDSVVQPHAHIDKDYYPRALRDFKRRMLSGRRTKRSPQDIAVVERVRQEMKSPGFYNSGQFKVTDLVYVRPPAPVEEDWTPDNV